MVDLEPFRSAETLQWEKFTVFAPHRGDDGVLIADGVHRLPLDTYVPDRKVWHYTPEAPLSENIGVIFVDPATLDDVHDAVRAWCREQLGRDDVHF